MGFLVTAGERYSPYGEGGEMSRDSFYEFFGMVIGFFIIGNLGIKSWLWFIDGKWIDIPFYTILYYLFGENFINNLFSNKFKGYNVVINYILTSESWIVLSLISAILLTFFLIIFNPIFNHYEEKYTRKEDESLEDFVKRMEE